MTTFKVKTKTILQMHRWNAVHKKDGAEMYDAPAIQWKKYPMQSMDLVCFVVINFLCLSVNRFFIRSNDENEISFSHRMQIKRSSTLLIPMTSTTYSSEREVNFRVRSIQNLHCLPSVSVGEKAIGDSDSQIDAFFHLHWTCRAID